MIGEVRESATARQARATSDVFLGRPDLMRAMTEVRARLGTDIRTVRQGETIATGLNRTRHTVAAAYNDNPALVELVASLRDHNRTVTRVMWALLGAAEQRAPAVVTETVGAISVNRVAEERHLDLTLRDEGAALFRPTHPVWLQLGSPLDGLYFVDRHTVAFAGGEENDLGLIAL
jgi:hypothetical protein